LADTVCFYFQVHQPFRVRPFSLLSRRSGYFDDERNRIHMQRAVARCYLPANRLMARLTRRHGERFRIAFSISGTALDQFEANAPEALESFASLNAEFLGETDSHSLACAFSPGEFREQIEGHRARTQELFGSQPDIFRNTELIYRDDMAGILDDLGYRAVLVDGIERILKGRSPHHVYSSAGGDLLVLPKDHILSDDIAFRFTDRSWPGWPLTAKAFAANLKGAPGDVVNLFLDYETFGEHHDVETGIFDFFEEMIDLFLKTPSARVSCPGDTISLNRPVDTYSAPDYVSWADRARDLSAWLGNPMQKSAAAELYRLETPIKAAGNNRLLEDWRKLQSSDHFYYMSTKGSDDGNVHSYFSPYPTPHDAFAAYMNILHNLEARALRRS
jgi:alpha-amylase